jgi:hypothetical protein
MRKWMIVIVLVSLSGQAGFAQQLRDQGRRANAPVRRPVLQDVVLGFYVSQFRQVAEVSDEVFVKVMPFLEQFVQDRFEITERRRRAFNQIRMLVNSGGSDDEIRRVIRALDGADAEVYSSQQDFMRNVDPLLDIRQQAKLRIFLDMSDQRIRQMLNGIQNPAAQPNRPNANRVPQ